MPEKKPDLVMVYYLSPYYINEEIAAATYVNGKVAPSLLLRTQTTKTYYHA